MAAAGAPTRPTACRCRPRPSGLPVPVVPARPRQAVRIACDNDSIYVCPACAYCLDAVRRHWVERTANFPARHLGDRRSPARAVDGGKPARLARPPRASGCIKQIITFAPSEVTSKNKALACRRAEYEPTDYEADAMFQGNLPEPNPAAAALRLGFKKGEVPGVDLKCTKRRLLVPFPRPQHGAYRAEQRDLHAEAAVAGPIAPAWA